MPPASGPMSILSGWDQSAKHRTRGDRRQLVRIAEQDQPRSRLNRIRQPLHQGDVQHRSFIDDNHLCRKRVVAMMAEAAGIGRVTEQAVNRRGLDVRVEEGLVNRVAFFNSTQRFADALAHPVCGFSGRRRQHNLRRIDAKAHHQAHDRDDDRRLAGARTARNNCQSRARRSGNNAALFIGHHDLPALHNHGTSNHIVKRARKLLRVRLLSWTTTQ